MAPLTPVLGDSPRVRMLEALVRLGDLEFTRGDLAREAGLYRMTTNRMVPQLIAEGFIERVAGGKRPKFKVRDDSPVLRVFGFLEAALGLLEEPESFGSEDADRVIQGFRRSIVKNQALVDGMEFPVTGQSPAEAALKAKSGRRT